MQGAGYCTSPTSSPHHQLPLVIHRLLRQIRQVPHIGPVQHLHRGGRVEHQPGVAAQMLMGKFADLLMHRIFVAANAFGFTNRFQCAEDFADFAT